jgi:synaptobrevin homolog YKT6
MKITAIGILRHNGPDKEPSLIGVAADVSNFGYFQRNSIKEMIMFVARTITQRTEPGQRQSVKHEEYLCHVHVKDNGLAGIVLADGEYPSIAAFSVVSKVLEEFLQKEPERWRNVDVDSTLANAVLEPALEKYQDPATADKLTKIQRDLDETKIVLHQTIESVLRRGEKLDALVDKSADLSLASQMFYKQARKTNACCRLM